MVRKLAKGSRCHGTMMHSASRSAWLSRKMRNSGFSSVAGKYSQTRMAEIQTHTDNGSWLRTTRIRRVCSWKERLKTNNFFLSPISQVEGWVMAHPPEMRKKVGS